MSDKFPHFVHSDRFPADEQYISWLADLKHRLRQSQAKSAVRVNTAMLEFYWSLGRDIVGMDAERVYGSGFFNRLSLDLRNTFPSTNGFSVTNLKYIKRWYLFYFKALKNRHRGSDDLEMPESFGLVPWKHHVRIITDCNSTEEALFYINKTIEQGWSRVFLERKIKENLYSKQGNSLNNFDRVLPIEEAELARSILKSSYTFDFLSIGSEHTEKELEDALSQNVQRFLLELGKGFAFVGRQVELRMPNGKSFFPDLVFYHTRLHAYVVLELKVVDFIPDFVGQLNFYVSAAEHLLRGSGDNHTIGLLICRSKDEMTVKWAFEGMERPMGVATYELQHVLERTLTDSLPSAEEIENALK